MDITSSITCRFVIRCRVHVSEEYHRVLLVKIFLKMYTYRQNLIFPLSNMKQLNIWRLLYNNFCVQKKQE